MAAPSYSESKTGSSTVTPDSETIPAGEEPSVPSRYPEETSIKGYRIILPQLPTVLPV